MPAGLLYAHSVERPLQHFVSLPNKVILLHFPHLQEQC